MMNWVIATTLALGPLTGIFVIDYFWLRRRRLDVDALYSSDPRCDQCRLPVRRMFDIDL
jgi:cytosine/uracil/thiamine/allantoin permease